MKTTYKYIKKTLPFVWAGLCLVSCNDFLTEDPKHLSAADAGD